MVARLHRFGVTLMACFTFGMDHDTPESIMRTAQFVIDAKIDLPRFAIVTPFPGTALHHRMQQEGRILTRNWELYDGQHVVFQPARMTVTELQVAHERAWQYAYRFNAIARRVFGSGIQIPLSLAANLGYRFYAYHLHDFYNCDWIIGQQPALPRLQAA